MMSEIENPIITWYVNYSTDFAPQRLPQVDLGQQLLNDRISPTGKVIIYIKNLLTTEEMKRRADQLSRCCRAGSLWVIIHLNKRLKPSLNL